MTSVRSLLSATVLAGMAAVVPPAPADPPGGTTVINPDCGMAAAGQEDGGVTYEQGTVWAGPTTVYGPNGQPVENLRVRCSIQLGSPYHDYPDVFSASANSSGNVVLLGPVPANIVVPSDKAVYLCAEYTWTTAGGQQYYPYDADGDPRNDAQCALTTEVRGVVRVNFWMPYNQTVCVRPEVIPIEPSPPGTCIPLRP